MTKVAGIAIIGFLATSCGVQQLDSNASRKGSNLKSVTINQPKFRETMDKDLTQQVMTEADELVKNLVVQISAEALNCDSGITAEKKDFGEKKISEASVDSTFKFRKGCDYVVKLVYVDSSSKKIILSSDGKTVNLTKTELEAAKPVAKVQLRVTESGKKFWSKVPLLETPADSDASIDPQINNGGTTQPQSTGLTTPVCPDVSALTKESSISCLNDYRKFYIGAADPYKTSSWHGKYSEIVNSLDVLTMVDVNVSAEKTMFCAKIATNHSKLTRSTATIAQANTTTSENDFLKKLLAVNLEKFEPVVNKTLQLFECQQSGWTD